MPGEEISAVRMRESREPITAHRAFVNYGQMPAPMITLMTDFGLVDPSVGACRGVLASLAPGVPLADIGHEVPAYDIERGARHLEYAVPYYPAGTIHVAVVDPGVGTARRGVALRTARGDTLVGPDNGLLVWAGDRLGGIDHGVELLEDAYRLHPVSHTFHARDVFCPAAAHLARGVAIDAFGPRLDVSSLRRLEREAPIVRDGEVSAPVASMSAFGNCHFDILESHWQDAGLRGQETVAVQADGHRWTLPYRLTFGDVPAGSALLLEDSFGRLCLAVNQGDASATFSLKRGTHVRFSRAG
jgi:S-adenosylmethionine hydrolase